MRDVLDELLAWWRAGEQVALGTVVGTWSSAPRQPGAAMVVGVGGEAVGSVSGGCVEGAVYELGEQVIGSGAPVLQRYGVSDDEAMGVGLTCGGILDVFVERVSPQDFPELGEIAEDIDAGRPVAVATVVAHPDAAYLGRHLVIRPEGEEPAGTLGSERIDHSVVDDARGMLAQGRTGTIEYGPEGERRGEGMRVFVASYAPKPRMLVFGAIDFAAAVARVGSFLGYHVTVCDARPVFATRTRFPQADEVVVTWPHRYVAEELAAGRLDSRTVACVLTHDPKFDVPLLEILLGEDAPDLAYIGAMGSRRTHEDRLARLREAGLSEDHLARLRSPIGLDLGARTPEETAVSIAAEIIQDRWGGGGEPLTTTRGPIHRHGWVEAAPSI
ncbi:XdhC family protein [Ornithinimicrobium avium]|uniref:XdhC/CoxI family protein n=1 Tax=Ornithinimicrobium avium TaxID=2283195 RepID=A0A345NJH9_9MICO|nr:XdhC/CoxI family protein [Ornithinimicrobium avium]AXH95187.1 XdhC/CoxI family protein [Ornithinimicrobium avium]